MNIKELVERLKINTIVTINGSKFQIMEHIVWWQAKSDKNYDKYVLQDETGNSDYRFWVSGETIGLSKIFEHKFEEPLPMMLEFEGDKYQMAQDEFCIAKQVEGLGLYQMGDAEIWWDFVSMSDKTKGLSLGRNWDTWEREDLKTTYIDLDSIEIKN